MGEVIYIDFRNEWDADYIEELFHEMDCVEDVDEDPFAIEILDESSGDTYLYFEEDMVSDIMETDSVKALSKMIDEL